MGKDTKDISQMADQARVLAECNALLEGLRDELQSQRKKSLYLDTQLDQLRRERMDLQAATELQLEAAKRIPNISYLEKELQKLNLAILQGGAENRQSEGPQNERQEKAISNWS